MLTNYFHAILSVVLAQFTGLGFLDGMEGVIRLAEASPYTKVCSSAASLISCFKVLAAVLVDAASLLLCFKALAAVLVDATLLILVFQGASCSACRCRCCKPLSSVIPVTYS